MDKIMVTVITPTYNRGREIQKLYESLKGQTSKNFEWLVIDDGSEDGTEEIMNSIMKKEKNIHIKYYKKKNGGKHTALNIAFGMLKTELAIIVDSDDFLVRSAIETIIKDWRKYKNERICGLCYKKIGTRNEKICDDFEKGVAIANYNQFIINSGRVGDKAEVFRSNILSTVRYPEYANEKFMGEGVMWSKISRDWDMVFVNEAIYVCQYLDGGLTRTGRAMRIKNPLGGIYHSMEYLDKIYKMRIREKNALLCLTYARFAKKNILKFCKESQNSLLLSINIIPSFVLYQLWLKRFMGGENG